MTVARKRPGITHEPLAPHLKEMVEWFETGRQITVGGIAGDRSQGDSAPKRRERRLRAKKETGARTEVVTALLASVCGGRSAVNHSFCRPDRQDEWLNLLRAWLRDSVELQQVDQLAGLADRQVLRPLDFVLVM